MPSVQPVTDAAAAAARYGGAELRAAEEQREQQRQARIAELRRRFVDPVLLMPGGGGGFSDSRGAVIIPDVGTIYFGAYRMTGESGALEADKGVLVSTDGHSRRLPAPVRRNDATYYGDGLGVQSRAGMGGSRRSTAGRLRSCPASAVTPVYP